MPEQTKSLSSTYDDMARDAGYTGDTAAQVARTLEEQHREQEEWEHGTCWGCGGIAEAGAIYCYFCASCPQCGERWCCEDTHGP